MAFPGYIPANKTKTARPGIVLPVSIITGLIAIVLVYFLVLNELTLTDSVKGIIVLGMIAFWICICGMVYAFLSQKNMDNAFQILYEKCDPEKFIRRMEYWIHHASPEVSINMLVLHQICGIYYAGNGREALDRLIGFYDFSPDDEGGIYERLSYHQLLFIFYINLNDIEHAERSLNEFQRYVDSLDAGDDLYVQNYLGNCKAFLKAGPIYLNMRKGSCDGAEEFFIRRLDASQTLLDRVFAHFSLARIFMMEKRFDEAEASFQYVLVHGNKLFVVAKARTCMDDIAAHTNKAPVRSQTI